MLSRRDCYVVLLPTLMICALAVEAALSRLHSSPIDDFLARKTLVKLRVEVTSVGGVSGGFMFVDTCVVNDKYAQKH